MATTKRATSASKRAKSTTTTRKSKSTAAKTAKKTATAKRSKTSKRTTAKAVSKSTSISKSTSEFTSKSISKPGKIKGVFEQLNMWNWAMAALHAAQGAAVLVLSRSDSLLPVTTTHMTADSFASVEGSPVLAQAQRSLFDVNLAYLVAAFFFMSAAAHLIIATVYRKRYEADLKIGINKARWFEYSISASTMMVVVAMLVGVSDVATLLLIFGATLVMNLSGLVMETHNQTTKKTNWLSYRVGVISGILPWLAVGAYLAGIYRYGEGQAPEFVLWIFASMLVLFSTSALYMALQHKGKGRWKDYLYTERAYMVLSLAAKAALAWQIFVGTLRS